MALQYQQALGVGATRVSAWSALLDQINVFPLADADTGRNLVVTLSPLRRMEGDVKKICRDLLFSARGNSGNIAARFFHEFIQTDSLEHLPSALRKGRDQAWLAVKDPRPGTMLSFFDALADSCREAPGEATPLWVHNVLEHAGKAVRETAEIQPVLKKAGVLDAGALGMFLFFDGFLNALAGCPDAFRPLPALFEPKLTIAPSFQHEVRSGFCVDAVVR
ncbi:MAG: DAK2 domain-containing protein, partial [Pseudomonadota bacterium]